MEKDERLAFKTIRCVCSTWRLLAFDSPIIWSSLSITVPRPSHSFGDQSTLASTWFARAGPSMTLALNVQTIITQHVSDREKANLEELLWRYQPRWCDLSLDLQIVSYFWDVFLGVPATGWSSLTKLEFYTYHFIDLDPNRLNEGITTLQSVKSLQCLRVVYVSEPDSNRAFSHTRLPELHLDLSKSTFTTSHSNLLSQYTHLTTLVLTTPDIYPQSPELGNSEPLMLSRLSSFSISTTNLAVLPHLITPALVELKIDLISNASKCQPLHLLPFLIRCSDTLTSVKLCHEQVTARKHIAEIILFLAIRPSIAKLSIDVWPFTPDQPFPEAVLDRNNWCPELRELSITVTSDISMLEDTADMREAHLTSLALFLQRRNGLGRRRLDTLTVRKGSQVFDFPYARFDNLGVDKICVTVPW
ncbi:hypothetical protein BKA70DRAFT_1444170 [Coprinopsis sp. MPI-PUGE-AT-0042]|nr:hypothetical protein BKA70DRAFT_1444170 [Coprinopsis sp. MPI-PUGE-AT-0042]